MVASIEWSGEIEGRLLVKGSPTGDDGTVERHIDRPGDAFVLLQQLIKLRHPSVAGLAAFTVCLAARGIHEGHFVRQIFERTFTFVRGADLSSKTLYDVITRLQGLLAESSLEGEPLRARFLEEARAIDASYQA